MPAKKNTAPALTDAQKAEKAAARLIVKTAAFNKLAPPRMTKAIKSIEMIGNLGSRNGYFYTDEQVGKMQTALNDAVKATMARFQKDAPEAKSGFSF